jgi:molecular chaperone GrpE
MKQKHKHPEEHGQHVAADTAFADVGQTAETPSEPASPADGAEAALSAERDRNLRLLAELENVRSRTARELAEQHRFAGLTLARDLLPVLDNVDRAIEHASQSPEAAALLEGFRLVRQQLATVLAQHHCVEIKALGEAFDPKLHSAILQQPSSEVPAGHVLLVAQAGYQMHDRVVRPSQVIVSSGEG